MSWNIVYVFLEYKHSIVTHKFHSWIPYIVNSIILLSPYITVTLKISLVSVPYPEYNAHKIAEAVLFFSGQYISLRSQLFSQRHAVPS